MPYPSEGGLQSRAAAVAPRINHRFIQQHRATPIRLHLPSHPSPNDQTAKKEIPVSNCQVVATGGMTWRVACQVLDLNGVKQRMSCKKVSLGDAKLLRSSKR